MTDKKKATKRTSSSAAVEFGRMGGNAVVKKYGKSYMKQLSKKAVKARWKGKKAKK